MTDKELLIQAIEKYATDTVGKLFGITSLPAQTLIRYAVRNASDKYGMILDIFQDKNGKMNMELLINALKSELKNRGGFSFMNVKFTETDVDELNSIINKLKANGDA